MRHTLFLLPFFFISAVQAEPASSTHTKYFDIKVAGVKIGELKATRTICDTITTYRLESKVKVWVIVSVELEHHIESVYHSKHLYSSVSVSKTNKGTYTSAITWKGRYYEIQVDSYKYNNTNPIHELIECNIARFYFDEPVNVPKTLADSHGTLATISNVKPGAYEVELHGNVNRYYYNHGRFMGASLYSTVRYEVIERNDKMLASSGIP